MSDPSTAVTRSPLPVPTVVESGTRFEGLVSFRGTVRVEGLVIGQVVAQGALVLGAEGEIRGRIEADEVTIEGTFEGEIVARTRIELRPTARVTGRICAPRVMMQDGALFDGQCEAGLPQRSFGEEEVAPGRVREPLPSLETASISA